MNCEIGAIGLSDHGKVELHVHLELFMYADDILALIAGPVESQCY